MNCFEMWRMLQKTSVCILLLILGFGGLLHAQRDSTKGTYCNVFYVTSDNEALLPFNDRCFVSDEYAIKDPTNIRAIGPIEGSLSLFERYQWLIHFYLPIARPSDRLSIEMPKDFYAKTLKMAQSKFFVTISDNRSSSRFDPVLDNVDFAAVSGSAKVLEFEDAKPGEPFASYKLQMDMRFRQVDRTGDSPKLVGDPIRVKMMVVIEPKQ
jgi:hypothetical protein